MSDTGSYLYAPRGAARFRKAQQGAAMHRKAPHGTARRRKAPQGAARNRKAPQGTARHRKPPKATSRSSKEPQDIASRRNSPHAAYPTARQEITATHLEEPKGNAPQGTTRNHTAPQYTGRHLSRRKGEPQRKAPPDTGKTP